MQNIKIPVNNLLGHKLMGTSTNSQMEINPKSRLKDSP